MRGALGDGDNRVRVNDLAIRFGEKENVNDRSIHVRKLNVFLSSISSYLRGGRNSEIFNSKKVFKRINGWKSMTWETVTIYRSTSIFL